MFARSTHSGNAKASNCGTSNRYSSHAFFVYKPPFESRDIVIIMTCKSLSTSCQTDENNYDYTHELEQLPDLYSQVLGNTNGRVAAHQRLVGRARLEQVYNRLKECGFNENSELFVDGEKHQFADFEELYDTIRRFLTEQSSEPVHGIGLLTFYDIATRIGYHQTPKIRPEKFVYLHSGTMTGAVKLLRRGLKWREPISIFADTPFANTLTAWQLEDYLCMAKDNF